MTCIQDATVRKIDLFSFLFQWLGSDPNYDCTIRVANLDLRDSGKWVCEIGSSTKESFQVQTKEFVIDIESECCRSSIILGRFCRFISFVGPKYLQVASVYVQSRWKRMEGRMELANIFYPKSNCVLKNSNYLIQVLLTK